MKNVFLINAHEKYDFAPGQLNRSVAERITENLSEKGYRFKHTNMQDDYDIDQEIEKHQWADILILQTPCNWMGVPWSFKKYMDFIYSAGMDGRMCDSDGRHRESPKDNYGMGGTLTGKKYMLSITFNAPREAFSDASQEFFAGGSVDELFWPMHLNFKFFGMQPMQTFACFDVMKNPEIEKDFERLGQHLDAHF